MSRNLSSPDPIQPLSIGNVVSASVRLYRSHLKKYLLLSLTAHLWLLPPLLLCFPAIIAIYFSNAAPQSSIPIWLAVLVLGIFTLFYCSARFLVNSAIIARLAFKELINQPESVSDARIYTGLRLWSFLRIAIQVVLSFFLIYIGFYFGLLILIFVLVLLGSLLVKVVGSTVVGILAVLAAILFVPVFFLGILWFYCRWVIAEIPLAVEENINGGESVSRSWELTKTATFRIVGVIIVAFLVTLPILLLFSYVPKIILFSVEPGSTTYWTLYGLTVVISMVGGVFVLPFWQAIKAVLYYDLCTRREGLGLRLRSQ